MFIFKLENIIEHSVRHSHVKFIEKDRDKLKNILLAKHLHQHEKEFQQKAILSDTYNGLTSIFFYQFNFLKKNTRFTIFYYFCF